jgi:hypothetical protein
MARDRSQIEQGPRDGAGNGARAPQTLRKAELPLRERRDGARVDGAHLQRGRQDQVLDAAGERGGTGAEGDRALPLRQGSPRRAGQQRPGTAGSSAPAAEHALLSDGPQDAEPSWKDGFQASRAQFAKIGRFFSGDAAAGLEHFELEEYIKTEGFELLRLLLQDHFDLRALREVRLEQVCDADGLAHRAAEHGHERSLASIVGTVTVGRIAYRRRGEENLYPVDAVLNLPAELHSHGLRELAAIESTRGSFEEAKEAIQRSTGAKVRHRQVEQLARASSVDFDAFYRQQPRPEPKEGDVVVISADGKGVAMRSADLRPATARAQAEAQPKLKTRRSKGEKPCKRIAEVAAVYTVKPVPRSATEVMSSHDEGPKEAPQAKDKWLTASVVEDAATVIADAFCEAERRDPDHARTWMALVDGNNHQINRITAEAKRREIEITIVIDLIHVLGYLWDAAWCFFDEGDPAAEQWVADKALAVLEGKAGLVAAAIRRKATNLGLSAKDRKNADTCAGYLCAKARYLDYPKALAAGWPVGTGIIEGACRYLVKDRMAVSGARWRLEGAEAVLKLRAIRKNGDWDNYFSFHLAQERQRVHESCYLDNVIPLAA